MSTVIHVVALLSTTDPSSFTSLTRNWYLKVLGIREVKRIFLKCLNVKMINDGVSWSLLGCSTHPTSTRDHGGNLNAYLAHTKTCGGQSMDKLGLFPSTLVWHHLRWKVWLAWATILNQEPEFGCSRQRRLFRLRYHAPISWPTA